MEVFRNCAAERYGHEKGSTDGHATHEKAGHLGVNRQGLPRPHLARSISFEEFRVFLVGVLIKNLGYWARVAGYTINRLVLMGGVPTRHEEFRRAHRASRATDALAYEASLAPSSFVKQAAGTPAIEDTHMAVLNYEKAHGGQGVPASADEFFGMGHGGHRVRASRLGGSQDLSPRRGLGGLEEGFTHFVRKEMEAADLFLVRGIGRGLFSFRRRDNENISRIHSCRRQRR